MAKIVGDKIVNTKEDEVFIKLRSVYIPRHNGYGARALSRKYNVNRTAIEKILRKETYREDSP